MPVPPVWFRFRASERILLGFFVYVCLLVPFFPARHALHDQPFFILAAVVVVLCCLSFAEQGRIADHVSRIRDWVPLALTFLAFREMELFITTQYDVGLESAWIRWDRVVLIDWHLRGIIEGLGPVFPFYLELCYLLVYGVPAYCVLALWLTGARKGVDNFYVLYLLGTLTAYGLFPYFPSQPPRIAYPDIAAPDVVTWVRKLNIELLNSATIHSGVFPSAHVSSVFAASWAMFLLLTGRRFFARVLLLYAVSVSIATVYGRYHYAADVLSGIALSFLPAAIALFMKRGRQVARTAVMTAAGTESSTK